MDDKKIKDKDLNKQSPLGTVQADRERGTAGGPKGTGFTNIQKIIGASQGNKLGEAVAGGVQRAGEKARSAVQQAGEKFGQQVQQAGNVQARQEQATNLLGQARAGQLTDEQAAQGQKLIRGEYEGPRDIENASRLAAGAIEAEQLGRAGASGEGRQALLQRFVGAPQYSYGQQKLDTLLLGADREALSQARAATRGIGDEAVNRIQAARGQAQATAGQVADFGKRFGEQVGEAYTGTETEVEAARKAAMDQEGMRSRDYETLRNLLTKPEDPRAMVTGETRGSSMRSQIENFTQFSPEQKDNLLKIVDEAEALGVDPRQALNKVLTGYTKGTGDAASAQQRASMTALAKLAGKTELPVFGEEFKAGESGFSDDAALRSQDALGRLGLVAGQDKKLMDAYGPKIHDPLATMPGAELEKYLKRSEVTEFAQLPAAIEILKKKLQANPRDEKTAYLLKNKIARHDAYKKQVQDKLVAERDKGRVSSAAQVAALKNQFNAGGF